MTTQEVVVSTNTLAHRANSYPVIMWGKGTMNTDAAEIYYVSDFDQKAKLIAVWDKAAGCVAYTYGTYRTEHFAANTTTKDIMFIVSQDFTADWKAGYVR